MHLITPLLEPSEQYEVACIHESIDLKQLFITAAKYECYFKVRSYFMPISCKDLHARFHPFHTKQELN